MPSRVILVTDEQNFGPKIRLQAVLRLDYRQVVASRNHAAVEHDKVGLARGENYFLRLTAAQGKGSEERKSKREAKKGAEEFHSYEIYGCYSIPGARLGSATFQLTAKKRGANLNPLSAAARKSPPRRPPCPKRVESGSGPDRWSPSHDDGHAKKPVREDINSEPRFLFCADGRHEKTDADLTEEPQQFKG
jgi:hypothetical protein